VSVWLLLVHLDVVGGLFVALLEALLVLLAVRRLRIALLANHRYRFTTRRWGWVLLRVVMIGLLVRCLI